MMKTVDPADYGLPPRTVLRRPGAGRIGIVIRRRSRIIMKDGMRILGLARLIAEKEPGVRISLITNAPVCGKTEKLLGEKGITLVREE